MKRKQYFDISYPFTSEGFENYTFDLNDSQLGRIKSQMLHLIFTSKGERLRHPDFGTDLIKYIFDPNDGLSWESVKTEIKETVPRWIGGVAIDDINVIAKEDGREIYVRVDFRIKEGVNYTADSIIVAL